MVGCSDIEDASSTNETKTQEETTVNTDENSNTDEKPVEETTADTNSEKEEAATTAADETIEEKTPHETNDELFSEYKLIEVDGGDLSGHREPKVVVDIGYGNREYWAFTNEHGQLVRVIANEIIIQDDNSEPVKSNGRYYYDEAKVPGGESDVLDEGHIIADSLGGVSNAYNITPQDSTLNRHGNQAYMEKVIRATNFEAIITDPDTETQIPSSYKYTYTLRGNEIVDTFVNGNPDKINESLGLTGSKSSESKNSNTNSNTSSDKNGDIASVDTNGNGKVTIKEAKEAGFSMPIT
ncbi:DNA/RNA non-specific endonuclease, partial [Bacillus piscicola]|uniref:DNA/RNA non-specific endonuclease n=1 Tax=Bacillus piscicola TaxID=1632684 RepID=UPI001F09AF7B